MISKILRRVFQTPHYNRISNIWGSLRLQPFSVVGHRTFGHELNGDKILQNMQLLN